MQRGILYEAVKLNIARKRRKRWARAVSAMAAVVVFVTTYALILPVITMESEYACGQVEHSHDESCVYTPIIDTGRVLSCSLALHVHDAACYEGEELICRYADFAVHSHDAFCFDAAGNLLCGLDEHTEHSHGAECSVEEVLYGCGLAESEGHRHSESCYSQPLTVCPLTEGEGHSHGESCYSQPQLVCTLSESEGHSHLEGCYSAPPLVCALEETPGHAHGAGCFGETPLICLLAEDAEHSHGAECFGAAPLICTLEEAPGHSHGAECFGTAELICPLEEAPGHSHGAECFGAAELICPLEEAPAHLHDESCVSTPELVCGLAEAEAHTHDESCGMTSTVTLICPLEEIITHRHEGECFDADGILVCEETEILSHRHDESCFTEHKHSEACWQTVTPATPAAEIPAEAAAAGAPEAPAESAAAPAEERILICPYHEHDASCLNAEGLLICAEPVLICDMEEHIHTEACLPVGDDGTLAVLFSIPEEYAAFVSAQVQFPYSCRAAAGSSLAGCAELPVIEVVNPEGAEIRYAAGYHWLMPDGQPVDMDAPLEAGLELTLRLYPLEEAEQAELVELSFVYGGEVLLSRSVYPGTLVSSLIDHDIQVRLDEIKSDTLRFDGWYTVDAEGNEQLLDYSLTAAETDAVYTARFTEYVPLTLHDIDPTGAEYESSPVELYIPSGHSLADSQDAVLPDGTACADCLWYTAEGQVFDPAAAVTDAAELYTYSYTLFLDMSSLYYTEEEAALAAAAEAAESAPAPVSFLMSTDEGAVAEDAEQSVLIAKRGGELITEDDFLVDGIDYTAYLWVDENGNEVEADSFIGTSLSSNYVLAPAAATNYNIKYNINVNAGSVFGTAPTVGGETTLTDLFSTDDGSYMLRVPNPTRYMVASGNKKTLYQFSGWKVSRSGTVIAAGETVDATWVSRNLDRGSRSNLTLTAQWAAVNTKDTVHFFVNVNCQVADMDGVNQIPDSGNFTPSVYSSTITVAGSSMTRYWRGVILAGSQYVLTRAEHANDTERIDREIRRLVSGYDSSYDTYNGQSVWADNYTGTKIFQVSDFPSDEQVLSVVRGMVQNGTVIRMNGVPIKAEDLTTDKFTVRWNVCKYDTTDGWHIDGLLVGKQAHLIVKKTFMGDEAAIEAVKNGGYSVSLNADSGASAINLLLSPAAEVSSPGYVGYSAYSQAGNTYTWTVPLIQGSTYTIRENNHISADPAVQSSASYTVSNSPDAFAGWLSYPEGGISGVKAYSYANDVSVGAFQTVEIRNSYVKSDTLTISKIDKGTGNGLPGISYRLTDAAGDDLVLYRKPGTGYYSMKAEDLENGFELRPDSVVVTDNNGTIFLNLDSGTFTLREAFPTGYGGISAITVTVGADKYGNVVFEEVLSSDSTIEVEGTLIDRDTATLTVYNVSQPTSVTARKVWVNSNDTREVTVALYRDGVAMGKEYEAVLNSANGWTHTWNDLPLYADGKAAEYSLREIKIGDTSYDPSADVDGYTEYIVSNDHIVYYKGDRQVERPAWVDADGVTQYADRAELTVRNETYRGQLMFLKVDEEGRALPGAVFRLYRDDDLNRLVAEAVSDENGRVVFENLVPNTYYAVREKGSPEGYLEDDSTYKVRLTAQGGTLLEDAGTGEQITRIVNYSDSLPVKLLKISSLDFVLPGVEFELYKNTDGVWQSEGSFVTGEDGTVSLGTLSHGSYRLVELKAPDGYSPLSGPIDFNVSKGKLEFVTSGSWSLTQDFYGDQVIRVVNTIGYELPQTGGRGWMPGYAAGLLLLAVPVLAGLRRLGRKEDRASL